jgi:glycosyltransferase involved in cell wall biosynthesis
VLRVGLIGQGFVDWGGGLDFLRMVAACLHAAGQPLELHFLLPDRGPRALAWQQARRLQAQWARWRGRSAAPAFAPDAAMVTESMADCGGPLTLHRIDRDAAALARAGRRLGLDVLLPALRPLPHDWPLPWVGYVYDFQHHQLPHLFSTAEHQQRDREFAHMLDRARVVIANARAVAADARAFRPQSRAHIVALPFSAAPVPAWLDTDVAAAQQRHGIGGPYFIVCNQFWVHKDHRTAFAAFAEVAASQPGLRLVCTGATTDPRHPGLLPELMDLARARGVADRVHVLGLVPKREQIALMRGALAVLQPTLCEGGPGGGAVYDAVSLGVPALVSDIAVNREIEEPEVSFFPVGQAAALAAALHERCRRGPAEPQAAAVLLERGRQRRARCGLALMEAIERARA